MLDKVVAGIRRFFGKISERKGRYLSLAASFAVSAALVLVGAAYPIERALHDFRDGLNAKPASGEIHMVEIDAKSLRELDSWPWPRSYHARLTDQLSQAGADQIVFDVDFSSRSAPEEDAAFAAAIARAGGKVVLPTFRQPASSSGGEADVENLPIAILREHAFLGSVNVHPDPDGQVNTYPLATLTGGIPRPSIGALLADASGRLGEVFDLDHSIELSTIPSHSFVDIMEGRFDRADLDGKRVIIGATAIEMGDRYATARFGVVPGVSLQVLAAETLLAGGALPRIGPWPMLLLALAIVALWASSLHDRKMPREILSVILVLMIFGISILVERFRIVRVEVAPAMLLIGCWLMAHYAVALLQRLDRERHVDPETGLPNLAAWLRRKPGPGQSCTIVAEIANFDKILSTLDEAEAVKFVSAVSGRLQVSCGGEALHRIGRHQFCWETRLAGRDGVELQLENAGLLFNAPVLVNGRAFRATLCFGIAEGDSADLAGLSHKATLAAKRAGESGARYQWHDAILAQDTDLSLFIQSEFEDAVATGQLWVAYQPKLSVAAGRVTAAEALVRWNSKARGPIGPADFIPVLERENLVEPLTLFVLREVIAALEEWHAAGFEMGCAINLSAALLDNPAFVESAIRLIRAGRFDLARLTLELTETAVLSSPERAAAALARLSALGVRLSIDDYGTGQSTLSYLKNFSATEIKIDQSFITSIAASNANRIMVRSTIEMAHALGIFVVAEGVEDEACATILRELGCDMLQGWHIGSAAAKESYTDLWCQPHGLPDCREGGALPGSATARAS